MLLALTVLALGGCQPSLSGASAAKSEDLIAVTEDPVAVAYGQACAYAYDNRLVTVEGVLHLRPRLLYCSAGGNAPSGRACQLKLLPDAEAPTGDVETERRYFTALIEDGRGPSQLNPRGYGSGFQPVTVFDADSVVVSPTDRVRVTGMLRVRDLFARDLDADGNPIGCTITEVQRIERVDTSADTGASGAGTSDGDG
ncbi:MAG: hypothetical protein AAF809_08115 [Bacteroidota bacterium]